MHTPLLHHYLECDNNLWQKQVCVFRDGWYVEWGLSRYEDL